MDSYLSDGQVRDVEEVLAVGAAEVPAERALKEMGTKSATMDEERRIKIGQRNVARQGLDGRARFGKYAWVDGKKRVRLAEGMSLGELAEQVRALTAKVEELSDLVQSQQSQLDRLDVDSDVGEKALASVGLTSEN